MCERQPLTHSSDLQPHLALDPEVKISFLSDAYTLPMCQGANKFTGVPVISEGPRFLRKWHLDSMAIVWVRQ